MLKVALHQPAIPSYRIPVFAKLNSEFDVTVFFGAEKALDNIETDGFPTQTTKFNRISIGKFGDLTWDWTQFSICGDRKKWDVVVVPWNTRYLSLVPAMLRAKFNRIPVILWGHGYSKNSGFLRDRVRDLVTRLASGVMFYDPDSRDDFKKRTGKTNAFCAPNAIDQTPIFQQTKKWRSSPESIAKFRADNGLKDRKVVLFVSRIEPKNRLDLLIKAVAKAKQKEPNILLIIIGKGSEEEVTTMKKMVAELDSNHHVRFLGPIYDESKLAPWFLTSQFYCYPSNIGLSLMHAFAYGSPVLLGDDFSKCNPEIYAFEPGKNGLTYKDESADDLAAQTLKILNDDPLRCRLSDGAMRTATELTTLDNMVEGFAEAIRFAGRNKLAKTN